MNKDSAPKDALLFIDGSPYKIGLRGMVFIYGNDGWARSGKDDSDLLSSWKKVFMKGIKWPPLMPKDAGDRKKKAESIRDKHREKMEPFVTSEDWKKVTPSKALTIAKD